MGFIYIVRNNINDKVYIGQTAQTIEDRFKQHIYIARLGIKETKFYKALNEIGYNNFYVDKLENCDNNMLNSREIYYIAKFDSYKNGYNSTPGGGNSYSKLREIDCDKFIEDYNNGKSLMVLAVENGIVIQSAIKLRDRLGLDKREIQYSGGRRSIEVDCFDIHFNYIKTYESITDAIKNIDVSNYGFCYIRQSTMNGNIAYGFRWQDHSELESEFGVYNTIFDRYEHEILGKQLIVDQFGRLRANNIDYSTYVGNSVKYKCNKCGEYLVDGICYKCSAKEIKANEELERFNRIKYMMESGVSLSEAGRILEISGNAVKNYCIRHNIKYNSKYNDPEIIMIDANGNETITTVNKAADYLINNKISRATIYSVRAKIKKAIENNKECFGYRWKIR